MITDALRYRQSLLGQYLSCGGVRHLLPPEQRSELPGGCYRELCRSPWGVGSHRLRWFLYDLPCRICHPLRGSLQPLNTGRYDRVGTLPKH